MGIADELFEEGKKLEQEERYAEAYEKYRLAAELGHALAQYSLGCCYHEGRGVEQNYAEAVKWYRIAAEQGDARAVQFGGMLLSR